MAKKCAYEVLGVDKNADEKAIKKAYKILTSRNHPDKNPGNQEAEEIYKAAVEAYDVLGDEKLKKKYDNDGGWAAIEKARKSEGNGGVDTSGYSRSKSTEEQRGVLRGNGGTAPMTPEDRMMGARRGGGKSKFSRAARKSADQDTPTEQPEQQQEVAPEPLKQELVLIDTDIKDLILDALRESGNDDLAEMLENARSEPYGADAPQQTQSTSAPRRAGRHGRRP